MLLDLFCNFLGFILFELGLINIPGIGDALNALGSSIC